MWWITLAGYHSPRTTETQRNPLTGGCASASPHWQLLDTYIVSWRVIGLRLSHACDDGIWRPVTVLAQNWSLIARLNPFDRPTEKLQPLLCGLLLQRRRYPPPSVPTVCVQQASQPASQPVCVLQYTPESFRGCNNFFDWRREEDSYIFSRYFVRRASLLHIIISIVLVGSLTTRH